MHKVLLLLLFILLHFRAPKNEIDAEFSSHCPYCRVAEGPSPCNGCDKNMTCFILSEYERFKKQAVKGVLTNTFEDRHFYPQNWRCDIKKMRKKYEFIRYSSDPTKQLMEDLFTIARRQGKLPKRAKNISAQTLCAQKLACAPQFRKYETMLRVSPKYKIVNCVVQKSMSTMMTGAMCYLYDEKEYENTGRSFDDEFNGRLCKSQNEFSSVNDVRNKYNISLRQSGWSFSMVVRHPIDRFVSGYVDRCVRLLVMNATAQCNGCRLNMTCFIENEYKRLMQISYKRKTRRTMEDAHFFPQVWHCDLPDEREFFEFLPYSTDSEEEFMPHFEDLLQRQDVCTYI
uniref:Uncharacterized protein n=1 Tax=Caenorhabditis japonica TaxID=281687 RepID=A0A8R1HQS0_CAEJA